VTAKPRVAYLGPPGTFTQAALIARFGRDSFELPCSSIEDAFSEVEQGHADFAVVPVENSTEGIVNNTQDCLVDAGVRIVGEIVVPIEHHLLAASGTRGEALTEIASHRQSLAQCRKWLRAHYASVPVKECSSNAEAAKLARDNPGVAAIAGQLAAATYGLESLANGIQDQQHNSTRFIVLGRQTPPASGHDKTSMLVYAANRPGALFHVLEPFEKLQISLTKIDSRPSKKAAWEYVFFIDFEGHESEPQVQELFTRLADCTEAIKLLGSYRAFEGVSQP